MSQGPVNDAEREVLAPGSDVLLRLAGPGNHQLRVLSETLGVSLGMRGQSVFVEGVGEPAEAAVRVLEELLQTLATDRHMEDAEVIRAARALRDYPDLRLDELFREQVVLPSGNRVIRPQGVSQQLYLRSIRRHDVVFGVGPAGTGKTYLAMAMAVNALLNREVKRVILARPAVEAGERLGFLPGDLQEKVHPYLRPLYDALYDMMDPTKASSLITTGAIEVAPLAFMRGRTLADSFVILDEAQNATREQMKMFLTRLGLGSKVVITGDMTQVDLGPGQKSGLSDAVSLLQGVEGIAVCSFSGADVVRHPLVQRIVDAYDRRDSAQRQVHRPAVRGTRYRAR